MDLYPFYAAAILLILNAGRYAQEIEEEGKKNMPLREWLGLNVEEPFKGAKWLAGAGWALVAFIVMSGFGTGVWTALGVLV